MTFILLSSWHRPPVETMPWFDGVIFEMPLNFTFTTSDSGFFSQPYGNLDANVLSNDEASSATGASRTDKDRQQEGSWLGSGDDIVFSL